MTVRKKRPRRKPREEGPLKKLTVEISYYAKPDRAEVSTTWRGKILNEIANAKGPEWQNIVDAVQDIVAETGPIGPGRRVTVRSTP